MTQSHNVLAFGKHCKSWFHAMTSMVLGLSLAKLVGIGKTPIDPRLAEFQERLEGIPNSQKHVPAPRWSYRSFKECQEVILTDPAYSGWTREQARLLELQQYTSDGCYDDYYNDHIDEYEDLLCSRDQMAMDTPKSMKDLIESSRKFIRQ